MVRIQSLPPAVLVLLLLASVVPADSSPSWPGAEPPGATPALAPAAPPAALPAAEAAEPAGAPSPGAPEDAPDFDFVDLQGGSHRLSDFRGRPVLLEFWATWCLPCRKGFPFLDGLAARHEPSGLKVLAVTLEDGDAAVEAFVAKYPVRFLVGRDRTGEAGEAWQVAAMPTTFLIDAAGRRLARFEGGSEEAHRDVERAVEAMLRGERDLGGREAAVRGSAGRVRAWQRGYLADPIMSLDGDRLTKTQREHIHSSKEGAAGDGGVAGGGCGCN